MGEKQKRKFAMDRSKVNLNVYKALTFENKPIMNLRKLAYYLESEFGGYWINHISDIVSNKKVSEKELYEFTIKIRNLDDFKDLDKIIIENNDNYVFSTYHTLYDFRVIEEILFPGTGRYIEEILKKSIIEVDDDFYLKRRIYFEVKGNELNIFLESDIVYKGSVEDFYKRNKEKIHLVPVRDKYIPSVKGKIIDFIGKMKFYRKELINLAHPKRIERYKNIPDEELVVRIKTYYGSELTYPTSELEIVKEDDFEEDEFEIEQIIDEIARILARNGYIYEIQIMPGEIPDILKLDIENLVFFDIEALKPEKIIYTIGVMDSNENVKQWFIDSEEDEKRAIIEFAQFTKNNKGKVYIGYYSEGFDEPLLSDLFEKYGLSLPPNFIVRDLFYEVIADPPKKIKFLGDKKLKHISEYLGYTPNEELEIIDGDFVRNYYNRYIKEKDNEKKEKLKEQILLYNREDLKRTKYVFQKLKEILEESDKKAQEKLVKVVKNNRKKDDLTKIFLVEKKTEKILNRIGIYSLDDLISHKPEEIKNKLKEITSKWIIKPSIPIELIYYYAKALYENKIIIREEIPVPDLLYLKNVKFIDLEYVPEEAFIFTIGIMDMNGKVNQYFIENEKEEKEKIIKLLKENEGITFIGYNSNSADRDMLRKCLEKHRLNFSFEIIDIYKEVIDTRSLNKQKIFFPLRSQGLKSISEYLGYVPNKEIEIANGREALNKFKYYRETKDPKIKNQILLYNEEDLKRLAYVFNKLKEIIKK
ncbi:MAG: ribonuclease H-like domain-containing protein [Candidatus Hydrothermia bacterium]